MQKTKIVTDTSIIISIITDEIEKPKIIEKTIGCELIAPLSNNYEVGNALSSLLKRKMINLSDAEKALSIYDKIPIKFKRINFKNSLYLCTRFNIYAYDAYIIDCAMGNNLPVFSLDKKIIDISKELNLSIIEV